MQNFTAFFKDLYSLSNLFIVKREYDSESFVPSRSIPFFHFADHFDRHQRVIPIDWAIRPNFLYQAFRHWFFLKRCFGVWIEYILSDWVQGNRTSQVLVGVILWYIILESTVVERVLWLIFLEKLIYLFIIIRHYKYLELRWSDDSIWYLWIGCALRTLYFSKVPFTWKTHAFFFLVKCFNFKSLLYSCLILFSWVDPV